MVLNSINDFHLSSPHQEVFLENGVERAGSHAMFLADMYPEGEDSIPLNDAIPVDPGFIDKEALKNENFLEYQGLIGTITPVISESVYESDRFLKLSNGVILASHRYTFPPHHFATSSPDHWDSFLNMKAAVVKPPSGFANCPFFDSPNSCLVLIEKNGQWHPFAAYRFRFEKRPDRYDMRIEVCPGIEFSVNDPASIPEVWPWPS